MLGAVSRVDVLVDCAAAVGGQCRPQTLAEITNEPFFADMNVKVLGYLRTTCEWRPTWLSGAAGASSTCPVSPHSTLGLILDTRIRRERGGPVAAGYFFPSRMISSSAAPPGGSSCSPSGKPFIDRMCATTSA
jgi:hypothetical protein